MPAAAIETKVSEALGKAGIRFTPAQLSNLSEQVSRALAPGGSLEKTICASGQSPCITLVRE
jgi:hypothetical protein